MCGENWERMTSPADKKQQHLIDFSSLRYFSFLSLLVFPSLDKLCVHHFICVCVCENMFCTYIYAVMRFLMHGVSYRRYWCVISAAQPHMGKVRHQLVLLWLIRASGSILGAVAASQLILMTDSRCVTAPSWASKVSRRPFFNSTSNYSNLVDIKFQI